MVGFLNQINLTLFEASYSYHSLKSNEHFFNPSEMMQEEPTRRSLLFL